MIKNFNLLKYKIIENIKTMPVEHDEFDYFMELGHKMIEYAQSCKAVGLAAPQIGFFKTMFVFLKNTENKWFIAINPSISHKNFTIKSFEMCLSYPGEMYNVQRFKNIKAEWYIKENGIIKPIKMKLNDIDAIIFQHEYDHLFGETIAVKGTPKII